MITPPPRTIWNDVVALMACTPVPAVAMTITFVVTSVFPVVIRVTALPEASVLTVVSPGSIVAGPLVGATMLKVTGTPETATLSPVADVMAV